MKNKRNKAISCEKQNVIAQVTIDDDGDNGETTEKDSFLFVYNSSKTILEPGAIFWIEYGKRKHLWPAIVFCSPKRKFFVEKCSESKVKITFRFLYDCNFITVVKEKVYPFKGKVDLFTPELKLNRSKKAKRAFEVANFMLDLELGQRLELIENLSKVNFDQLINQYRNNSNTENTKKYYTKTIMGQLIEHVVIVEDSRNLVHQLKIEPADEEIDIDD